MGLFVASAGFGTSGPLLECDLNQELNMVDVNCRALLQLSVLFGRRFAARGRGGLVLLSSLVAFQGVPRSANYAATKSYVQTLAEGLHLELAARGVDVLASAPGPVLSGFGARSRMKMTWGAHPRGGRGRHPARTGETSDGLPGVALEAARGIADAAPTHASGATAGPAFGR